MAIRQGFVGVFLAVCVGASYSFGLSPARAAKGVAVRGHGGAHFEGLVLPSQKASLAFASSGLIARLPKAGDTFRSGQVIAALNETQSKIGVIQAQAGLEIAQLDLQAATHNKKKTQRLLDEKIVSDIALVEISFSVGKAKARVKDAQAKLKAANERYRSCFLRAPFKGVVVDLKKNLGEWVSTGTTIVELVNLTALELPIDLPPKVAQWVKKGQQTDLLLAGKKVGRATVRTVMPYIDPASGSVRVVWKVTNSTKFLAGSYVTLAPWLTEGKVQ
jgi:RND family efflux transporter MFP subunit